MKILIPAILLLTSLSIHGQNRIGTGAVQELYEQHCLSCHGAGLDGGLGGSLLDSSDWKHVGKGKSFLEYVREGDLEAGMPSFKDGLSDKEIRSLEIYIDEVRQKTDRETTPIVQKEENVYTAGDYQFQVETVIEGLSTPWSIYFFTPEHALITEKAGDLRIWKSGQLSPPVDGTPKVDSRGQGGLLEVAAHPDYADNGWIYLGFSVGAEGTADPNARMTKVVRGRIADNCWIDEEVIFEVPAAFQTAAGVHFGTRFVFQDGYLYFSIGDRGAQDQAQDLTRPNGKVHRIYDDGRIPADNPFVDQSGAYASIWTYGNRNIQGLAAHPETGWIYATEHGPRGGDEINLIEKGLNYGWPVITHGMNYNGTPITEKTEAPGMEQPLLHWTPSIAVCGIDFYQGTDFPAWKHDLFVGGLASQELHRLRIDHDKVIEHEIVLKGEGRVRDVASGPDGYLYLVLNSPDRVVRLVSVR
ncbi:MAG: secretion protein HlyD [Puniceicoccaceae bacterium]|nr:MAG: secretion protein HlyD [Puniceicoccaceae bacterium]